MTASLLYNFLVKYKNHYFVETNENTLIAFKHIWKLENFLISLPFTVIKKKKFIERRWCNGANDNFMAHFLLSFKRSTLKKKLNGVKQKQRIQQEKKESFSENNNQFGK